MKTERIAHDGAAEMIVSGTPLRVHGMLPGEEGVVEAWRHKRILVGTLKELSKASPSRKTPEELHYLSCSPWQVMEYALQAQLKQQLLVDLFSYYDLPVSVGYTAADQFYGYRTKIEFSFCDREGDTEIPLSLAFHERGGGVRRLPLAEGCALASDRVNRAALAICALLRAEGYVARDLKTLIIRESKSDGKLLALLFAKKKEVPQFDVSSVPDLSGFIVFHSTEKSPASVPTKELWRVGDDALSETIDGISIRYSWDSFFQNNIGMFKQAVDLMRTVLSPTDKVLELYAGAGTIGLLLARQVSEVKGVEIVAGAVDSANMNARVNGVEHYTSECLPAEAINAEAIAACDVLVLDPPRAGLHPKLLTAIAEAKPKRIIYLSCNPETQARDYSALAERYEVSVLHGFDFYPQTPHLESLLVLNLRDK